MADRKQSIIEQIVELLYAQGSMTVKQMCETIKFPYKSVSTKALELRTLGLASKDTDGIWSLLDGVTPQTLLTGELKGSGAAVPGAGEQEEGQKGPPIARIAGIPLEQRGMFIKHCTDIGMAPREAIPTIADIFFSGDINSLPWLNQVLSADAAGYVTPQQRRLMLSWWSNTRQLEFDEEAFGFPPQNKGEKEAKGKKTGGEEVKVEKRLDPGMGWKVDRDNDGAWITVPGGPMSYQEAVEAAERRALIDTYKKGGSEQDTSGEEGLEEGTTARKGGRKPETLLEYMMKKMIDNMLEGGKGKGDGDSETVKMLTERIDSMERDRQEQRFERIEGMVANALSKDPWEEYDRITAMKERLGVGGQMITDSSPAVQLIKDTTDKLDKGMNRLVGVMERTVLRSDHFAPENTRTTQEKEAKAGDLLGEVEDRTKSRNLRRATFGV